MLRLYGNQNELPPDEIFIADNEEQRLIPPQRRFQSNYRPQSFESSPGTSNNHGNLMFYDGEEEGIPSRTVQERIPPPPAPKAPDHHRRPKVLVAEQNANGYLVGYSQNLAPFTTFGAIFCRENEVTVRSNGNAC
jgi:hypothetical protein